MLAALVALVALSAYFSATETAFTSLNRIRLKTRADDGDKRAARTLALAADFDRLLSTLLIGNNIVNNVATTIGAVLFIQLIGSAKGPTVSATVLTVLPEMLRGFDEYRMLLYSIILIAVMLFKPSGLLGRYEISVPGLFMKLWNKLKHPKQKTTGEA